MVNKLLFFACVVMLMMFFFSSSQEPEQAVSPSENEAMTRRATDVVMVERSLSTGKTMEVRAREVVETGDRVARLSDFVIEQEGGPRFSGRDASYDLEDSFLTIHGPLGIEAGGGATVHIDGLSWDRKTDTARTEQPVRFEGWEGVVTADRAAFSEGFTIITLTGRVHATIMQNILDL